MSKEYQVAIASGGSSEEAAWKLEGYISDAFANGWELQGGVSVTRGRIEITLAQALVRERVAR